MQGYAKGGIATPEAHTHDGYTTVAGWIHGLFAGIGVWVLLMFFLTPTSPPATARDILIVSAILTPFFFLGVTKFSRKWKFVNWVRWQVAGEIALVWIAAWVRIEFYI
jgi:hypothetical protein